MPSVSNADRELRSPKGKGLPQEEPGWEMKPQLEVNPLCPVLLQFTRNPVCPLVGERIPNLPGAMLGHCPGQQGLLRIERFLGSEGEVG